MYNETYEYEPTDIEDEVFLTDIPLGLIEKSIKSQFENPVEDRKKDYVQSFITKYQYAKGNQNDDPDSEYESIDKLHDEFVAFMEEIFQTYLGIGMPEADDMPEEDQHELIHLTYRYFIKNIKKNFITIINNYIIENKDDLAELFEKKKDVTSMAMKSDVISETDIIIIANLKDVVAYILETIVDIDEFFKYNDDGEYNLELEFVKEHFESFELTGNFIGSYIDMVDGELLSEIHSKVRNKILKSYSYRKKDVKQIVSDYKKSQEEAEEE